MRIFNALMVVWSVAGAVILILFCLLFPSCAGASVIKDEDAIRAIVGEGASEGLDGMRAIASVIRNRGSLRGIYGLHAKHVRTEPAWVFKMAKTAWEDSERYDFSGGATHFEGVAFKKPYWVKDMVFIKRVANTNYYKEKKK